MLEREGGRGRARWDVELGEDVLQMPGDRVFADHELDGDVAVGLPRRDEAQDLDLAHREPSRALVAPEEGGRGRRLRRSPQAFERGDRVAAGVAVPWSPRLVCRGFTAVQR